MALSGFSLKMDRYAALLEKLIGETKFLQDNPPKFVPQEAQVTRYAQGALASPRAFPSRDEVLS